MAGLTQAQREWLTRLGDLVGAPPSAEARGPQDGDEPESKAPATAADTAVEAADDRRREFKRARKQWVDVKLKAEADLEKVKDGARLMYMADPEQYPKIVAGCKQIDAILDHLDDELRDTLDQYAKLPLRAEAKRQAIAAGAIEVLGRYRRYVDADPVMKAIDEKEFADVAVHAPVSKALRDLQKALG